MNRNELEEEADECQGSKHKRTSRRISLLKFSIQEFIKKFFVIVLRLHKLAILNKTLLCTLNNNSVKQQYINERLYCNYCNNLTHLFYRLRWEIDNSECVHNAYGLCLRSFLQLFKIK